MSFADLEARTNAAVMRRLANALAIRFRDLVEIPVIFDRETIVQSSTGAAAPVPTATVADSDAAQLESNADRLTIKGDEYIVRNKLPDGTGLTTLILEAC